MNMKLLKRIASAILLTCFVGAAAFAELEETNPFKGKTSEEAKTYLDTQKASLATVVTTKKTELSDLIKSGADATTINTKLSEVLLATQDLENIKSNYSLFRIDLKEQRSAMSIAQKTERTTLNDKVKIGGGSVNISGTDFSFKGKDELKAEKDSVNADLKAEKAANTILNKTEKDNLKNIYTADLTNMKNVLDRDLATINAMTTGGEVDLGDGTKMVYDKNALTKIRVNADGSNIVGEDAQAFTALTSSEASAQTLTKQTQYSVSKTQRKAQYEVDKVSLKASQDQRKQALVQKTADIKTTILNGGTISVNGVDHVLTSTATNKATITSMKEALKIRQAADRAAIK